ncbi:2634_t:CDS:2, partial [Gigaspora rosea]
DLKNQLLNFQRFVICLRQKNNYPLEMIANMDKTPVWFDMASGLTVNLKGAKTVHIRTTGNDKNKFTIVLTCFANGRKLPPIIIFKLKGWPANAPRPLAGVVVWFQEKGWMDKSGMSKWVKYWDNAQPGPCNSRTILVFDSFKAHITDRAKAEFRSGNTNWLEDHLIYATDDESDESEIEDFDDNEEDNEDEEFDENEEFNEIKESNKDDE